MELDEEAHQLIIPCYREESGHGSYSKLCWNPDVWPLRGFVGRRTKPGHRQGEVPLGRN